MKRIISFLLTLSVFIMFIVSGIPTFADNTSVRLIDESEETSEVSMNNMNVGDTIAIEGYGNLTITSVGFIDSIPTDIDPGSLSTWRGDARSEIRSGPQSDFLRIRIHILNTQHHSVDFLDSFGEVVCCFDNDYQFGGWFRQERFQWEEFWTMYEDIESSYAIDPLYEGYYDVVVTLPNYVVESKAPLMVTFSIANNELTCNVR